MPPETADYRVSRLIVLCKDCGDDVGLYPSRHKCRMPERPPLPILEVKGEQASGGYATYWDMFKNTVWSTDAAVTSDNDTSTPGGQLWTRVLDATTTVAKAVGVVVDYESDSDVDESGETKLTRELKAYYTKQGKPIPQFLTSQSLQVPADEQSGRLPRSRSFDPEGSSDSRGRSRGRADNYQSDREGSRYRPRQQSQDPDAGRQRMRQDQQRVPIPIRARPLRDEDDAQEIARRQESADRGGRSRSRVRPEEEGRRYAEREAALAALDGRVNPQGKSKRDYGEDSSRVRGGGGQGEDYDEPPRTSASSPSSPRRRLQNQPRAPPPQPRAPPPQPRDAFGDSRGYDSRGLNSPRISPRQGSFPAGPGMSGRQGAFPGGVPMPPAQGYFPGGPPRQGSFPAPKSPVRQYPVQRTAPPPRIQPYAEPMQGMPSSRGMQGPPPSSNSRMDYDPRTARQPPPDVNMRFPPPRQAPGNRGAASDPRMVNPNYGDPRMQRSMADPRMQRGMADPRMQPAMADPRTQGLIDPRGNSSMDYTRGDSRSAAPMGLNGGPRIDPRMRPARDPRSMSREAPRRADPRMGRY